MCSLFIHQLGEAKVEFVAVQEYNEKMHPIEIVKQAQCIFSLSMSNQVKLS